MNTDEGGELRNGKRQKSNHGGHGEHGEEKNLTADYADNADGKMMRDAGYVFLVLILILLLILFQSQITRMEKGICEMVRGRSLTTEDTESTERRRI